MKTKDHKEHQAPLKQEYHTKPVQLLNMPDFIWNWSISFSTGSAGLPHTSPFGALFVHDRTRQLDAQFPAWVRKMYSEFVELDKNAKPFILMWICLVWQPWNWNSKTKERKLTRVVVCQHRRSQIREPKMLVGNSKFFTAAIKARAKCWCLKLCHAFLIQTSKTHAVARIWIIRVEHNMLLLWKAIFKIFLKDPLYSFHLGWFVSGAIMNFEFQLTPPGTKVDGPNP